ncbi:hypothetical protein [Neobacillus drentensis]|nr:hypothetical protein [Neobacillus drentensis]
MSIQVKLRDIIEEMDLQIDRKLNELFPCTKQKNLSKFLLI